MLEAVERIPDAVVGLLGGACLGAGVGAIGLAVVGPLITGEVFLFIVAGMAGAILGGAYGAVYGMLHGVFINAVREDIGDLAENKPKLAGRMIVIHLISLGAVTALAAYIWSVQAVNLPEPSDVQSMTVDFFTATGKPGSFAVPSRHIPTVLTALSPATREWSPKKWEVLGQLQITCKDGKKMTVDLYRTYHAIGAFSVHLDDSSRNSWLISHYFRGGTDQAIESAIKTAAESAKLK
jgi:hypothetical protein